MEENHQVSQQLPSPRQTSDLPEPMPEPLLSTGQTIGYYGVNGVITAGNQDDGDLIRGRLPSYDYTQIQVATTQLENIVVDRNTGLMWIRDVTLLDEANGIGVHANVRLDETVHWQTALELSQALIYGEYDDWRLPNLKELQTLVHYGRSQPSIDTNVFPTPFDQYPSVYFWTSTTYPAEVDTAFYVNFLNGHTFRFHKETPFSLRPVRSIEIENPVALLKTGQTIGYKGNLGEQDENNGDDGDLQQGLTHLYRFQDDGLIDTADENIVLDQHTGLMWIRNPLLLSGDDTTGVSGNVSLHQPLDWQSSLEAINALHYGGYDDWRMPNIVELKSISQPGNPAGILDAEAFVNAPLDPADPEAVIWWSSTTSAFDKSEDEPGRDAAWYVTAAMGTTNFGTPHYRPAKSRPGFSRPVRNAEPVITANGYLPEVRSTDDFESITIPSPLPNLLREGKYILPVVNTDAPFQVAYQNVKRQPLHYEFLLTAFPASFVGLTQDAYTALVSQRNSRQYWAGGLASFQNVAGQTVYGFDIFTDPADDTEWPTELEVAQVYQQLSQTFRRRPLVYSPRQVIAIELAQNWVNPPFSIEFPVIQTTPDYEVYTVGETYGTVRLMRLNDLAQAARMGQLSRQEIVVLDQVPADLESIVAGVITGEPQGTLSHLNIRAARRGTPNFYLKDSHNVLADYEGQLVRLSATRTGYYLETDVTQAEAEAWWAMQHPQGVNIRPPDLEYIHLDTLQIMGQNDQDQVATIRFGGKAANLARFYTVLPTEHQVPGFAIPFSAYHHFMQNNVILDDRPIPPKQYTYADYLAQLHTEPEFQSNPQRRAELLANFRREIRDFGTVPPDLVQDIASQIDAVFGEGVMVRFRSSSNAEDDLMFNGAGLYDSTSVCVKDSQDQDTLGPSHCDPNQRKERMIERGLKKVWASLWNLRAWEERDLFGIDHQAVNMGILVTPAFPNERANGVAFTGDPANPNSDTYLVNVQDGDTSVVLPDPGIVPEQDQLLLQNGQIVGIERIQASNLPLPNQWILSEDELRLLGSVLMLADQRFPLPYSETDRSNIMLDLEFKIRRGDNALLIKQIRPFLAEGVGFTVRQNQLRLHIPQTLTLCNQWREGYNLQQEWAQQMMLTVPANDILIPLDQVSPTPLALFGDAAFGSTLPEASPINDGLVHIEPLGTTDNLQVTITRGYMVNGKIIEITLPLSPVVDNAFNIQVLDQTSLHSNYRAAALVRHNDSDRLPSRLRLAPCGLSDLPLIRLNLHLENDIEVRLQQRRERDDGVSGLADLVGAEIILPDQTIRVTERHNLIYAADRHHWNEQFGLLFDTPLGEAYGLAIYQHYTAAGDPTYSAAWLDAGLNKLTPLDVESIQRTVVPE
ncbi:MAG: DUF1566 domain-containing protein [Chloroflexota bacterium]